MHARRILLVTLLCLPWMGCGGDKGSDKPAGGDADAGADAGGDGDSPGDGDGDGDGDGSVPENMPPTAVDDGASTDEDTAVGVDVLGNDSDPESGALTLDAVTAPSHGTAAIDGDMITYTPEDDFNGTDSFEYTVSDPDGATATASVTVTITATPDLPTAAADAYSVDEDGVLVVDAQGGVLLNDADADGDALTATLVDDVATGTLVLATDGSFDYTPAQDFFGDVTFTYHASAGGDETDPVTVTLTVAAVNDVPVFTPGVDDAVLEDAGPQTRNGWATGIDAGAPGEQAQVLAFVVTTDNDALFSALPTVGTDGTLSYTAAADTNGVATVTVALTDDGGTDRGGLDASAAQVFTITVAPVNDMPSFTRGQNQVVFEDAGSVVVPGWATAVLAGPAEEGGQALAFTVVTDNPALFAQSPALTPGGELQYETAADQVGSATVTVTLGDDGGTADGGVDTSAPVDFLITVTPVNDPPSFDGSSVSMLEDAGPQTLASWATNIIPGPADEAGQAVTFGVTPVDPSFFSTQPAVDAAGTLTFTVADDVEGMTTITVVAMDDGGTGGGGVDTTAPADFTITVGGINDGPSFVAGADPVVLEDAGPQTIAGFAGSIDPGAPSESGQGVSFVLVSNDDPTLFTAPPSISPAGDLSFEPATDRNGVANLVVHIVDDGGQAGGGVDTGADMGFAITVTAVNDAPNFAGQSIRVLEDSGAQAVPGWVSSSAAGPADEVGQSVAYTVTPDVPGSFAAQPAVASDGTLSFQTAADAVGVVTLEVTPVDDGGTADGGNDTGVTRQYTITIDPVNDAPSFTKGTDQNSDEDAGPQIVAGWATGVVAGPADESGQSLSFAASTDNDALFAALPAVASNGDLSYEAAPDAYGSATVQVILSDDGGTAFGGQDAAAPEVFTITINEVDDPVIAVDDAATTSTDLFVDIAVLDNDINVDPDVLTIVSVTDPPNGTAIHDGVIVTYTPDPGFEDAVDSFDYVVSDGRGNMDTGTVTVTVDADVAGPVFVSSVPVDGDLLSIDEAFGGGFQLAPATFVFDDLLLDGAGVSVVVTHDGNVLSDGPDYFVDSSTPGQIQVFVNPGSLIVNSDTGDPLVFDLSTIADSHGNPGAPVQVSVTYDQVFPVATQRAFTPARVPRSVLSFSEPMDTGSASAFLFRDDTLAQDLVVEPDDAGYLGSGWASLDRVDDTFFVVARDDAPDGHTVSYDARGLTDLAGNEATGSTTGQYPLRDESNVPIVAVQFVDPGTYDVQFEILGGDIVNDAFLLGNGAIGADYDVLVIADGSLDGPGGSELENRSSFDGLRMAATLDTVNVADDTLRFSPTGEDAAFTWAQGSHWEFMLRAYQSATQRYLQSELAFVVQRVGTDGVAPSVTAAVGRRASASDGSIPVLRRGEGLELGLSEVVDLRTLTPANFTVRDSGNAIVAFDVLFADSDDDMQAVVLRATDGAGGLALLAPGPYELEIAGVADICDPPNVMTSTFVSFDVADLGAQPPSLLDHAPADGSDINVQEGLFVLAFDDTMWSSSFRDVGDPATRGVRLEELWSGGLGSVYIPIKGLITRSDQRMNREGGIVSLSFEGNITSSTTFRFSLRPGALSVDGAPVVDPASLSPFTFSTASSGAIEHRPVIEGVWAQVSHVLPGEIVFGGVPMESEARGVISARDPDNGPWESDFLSITPEPDVLQTVMALPDAFGDFTVTGAAFDPFLIEGVDNEAVLTIRDALGNDASLTVPLYRYDEAALLQSRPSHMAIAPGRFTFSGAIPASIGTRVSRVGIYIVVVDTTSGTTAPFAITDIAYKALAQVTRNPDGSLSYAHTMPLDRVLPALPVLSEYLVVAQPDAFSARGPSGSSTSAILPETQTFVP